jgi:LAS superfamily LD-carboxypeptidase LdcB
LSARGAKRHRTPHPVSEPEPAGMAELKRAVLDGQISHLVRKGRHFFAAVPASELAVIEGRHRMRKQAAGRCRELLSAARAALEEGKQQGDARARQTDSVVVHSAYRTVAEDTLAWEKTFRKHYDKAMKKNLFADDPLGPRAVAHMVKTLKSLKAPPGYSNHSNGAALDFGTTFGGDYYGADSSKRIEWRGTWLHPWLLENAKTFGFKPLVSEEWHWDFEGP